MEFGSTRTWSANMHPDKKVGLALGILLIGIVGALFFRNEAPESDQTGPALANPQARWMMERLLGVARGRKLPPFSRQQVMRWAARRGLTRPSQIGRAHV